MDFAQIWVILKAESCWAVLILYRIGNTTTNTIQSLYRYLYRRAVISVSLLASSLATQVFEQMPRRPPCIHLLKHTTRVSFSIITKLWSHPQSHRIQYILQHQVNPRGFIFIFLEVPLAIAIFTLSGSKVAVVLAHQLTEVPRKLWIKPKD